MLSELVVVQVRPLRCCPAAWVRLYAAAAVATSESCLCPCFRSSVCLSQALVTSHECWRVQGEKMTTASTAKAVANVTFEGVSFTGQRPTYMEPHVSTTTTLVEFFESLAVTACDDLLGAAVGR